MKKISISVALLIFVVIYLSWHGIYQRYSQTMNIIDNLAVENTQTDPLPFVWLRESYREKDGRTLLIDRQEECFSVYELKSLFSSEKDRLALQQFCDSAVENNANGYKIAASCQNQSARFYVDVDFRQLAPKMYEWQQVILDFNHNVIQQERIIFQQQGKCNAIN